MSQKCITGVAALAVAVLAFAGARGASITAGNIPQSDENVLLGRPGLLTGGKTVQGWTNQSQFVVDFTSTSNIKADPKGQAHIQSTVKHGSFYDLVIAMHDSAASFTSLIFNLDAVKNGWTGVRVFGQDDAVLLDQTVSLRGSGQNFFTIVAGESERISRVQVLATVGISDFKQFRLGGAGLAPVLAPETPGTPEAEPVTGVVPAPASTFGGLVLMGLLGAARHGRRSRQRAGVT